MTDERYTEARLAALELRVEDLTWACEFAAHFIGGLCGTVNTIVGKELAAEMQITETLKTRATEHADAEREKRTGA